MKMIDIPPVWLCAALVLAYLMRDVELGLASALVLALRWLGTGLAGIGVALMILAVYEMTKQRTTVIPHQQPNALVTSGIFARSRNPIYLGDVLVLVGAILFWAAYPVLVIVPVFVVILRRRFIDPEENRLRDAFGDAFKAYANRTKRWI